MKNYSYLFLFFIFCSSSNLSNDATNNTTSTTNVQSPQTQKENINPAFVHTYKELEGCNSFLGSENKITCNGDLKIIREFNFNEPISNIYKQNENIIIVFRTGKIILKNIITENEEILIDLSEKVLFGNESGLFDIAFSKSENTFLVSYVDKNSFLNFEIFYFDKNIENIINSEILLKKTAEIAANNRSHFGGKIFWSDYFNDYLVSFGDFYDSNYDSRLNYLPQDTSSYNGKIIILGTNDQLPIINQVRISHDNVENIPNIIASGLRHPWQFFEYKDYLVVFDVGLSQNEEVNISRLNNLPLNFGWPVFEGPKKSSDIDQIQNYKLEVYLWSGNVRQNALSYIERNSIFPAFYYNHSTCDSLALFGRFEDCSGNSDIYRGAVIGGDIITNFDSDYYQDIFFTDYVSGEIFALNLLNRSLKIVNSEIFNSTSLRVFDHTTNQIMLSSNNKIIIAELP